MINVLDAARVKSLKAKVLLHEVYETIESLQTSFSSLQREENEDVQVSLKKHQMGDNETFDKCKNKLHQVLCVLDNFHESLDNLQKVQEDSLVQH